MAFDFFYRAKPPTGVILGGFPSDKARLVKISRKRSTCSSISRKASQMVTKPATCSTLVGLRCYSSRPHSLRSPCKNQCTGYPSPCSWKARKETTSSARGCRIASPSIGAL